MDPSLSLLPVVWSQRSMNFLKIQVIQDKSKPTRVAMIWLRVKVNRTRLCTAVHFARNEIKYQKSPESGLFQYILYACTIACLSFIPLYKQRFYKCYSLPPLIEFEGKQKITVASICDEKEILKNLSLIIKRYKRPPKIARCEVTHNFSLSHSANLLHPGF